MPDNISFGFYEAKIATWSAADTWGTAIDLGACRAAMVDIETVSGRLEGNDAIADLHSQIIAARVRFSFGSEILEALEIMLGLEITGTVDLAMIIGKGNMPYFGFNGRARHTSGGGSNDLFIPKMKLEQGVRGFGFEYGQHQRIEIEATAIYNDALYGVLYPHRRVTTGAVEIPPAALATS